MLARRSAKLCTEFVDSWCETEGACGTTSEDDDDENAEDTTGTMAEVRLLFEESSTDLRILMIYRGGR